MHRVVSVVSLLLLPTALMTAGSASAESATLSVSGRLVPSACMVSLAGGGTVVFGDIPAHQLSATDFTMLPEKQVALAVDCAAATRFGLYFTDAHPEATAMPKNAAFLGLAGQSTLTEGYIEARLTDGTADNQPAAIYRTGADTGDPPHLVWFDDRSLLMRWRPDQMSAGRATLRLSAYLPPTGQAVIGADTALEGRLSIELVYL